MYVFYKLGGLCWKKIPEVLQPVRDQSSRDASKTERKYFSTQTDLKGK